MKLNFFKMNLLKDAPWSNTTNAFDPRAKPWASEHWIYLVFDKELKYGKSYTLKTGALDANRSEWKFVYQEKNLRSEAVHVNTLGYAAKAPKYGYIYHWMGSLGNLNLSSYAGKTFRIYKDGRDSPFKTYQLKRDISGNASWGGYGILLPAKNTEGWERISFQLYADKPITTVRMELFQTDVSQGSYIISNLSVPANK